MKPERDLQFPFLTRKMLDFGLSAVFKITVTTSSISATETDLEIQGATKAGIFKFKCEVTNAGGRQEFTFSIPDMPIFLSVVQNDATTALNVVYAIVKLTINDDIAVILTQGFPNNNVSISWPVPTPAHPLQDNGATFISTATTPGAGAEWTRSFDTNAFFDIIALHFTFTASATVANRRPRLKIFSPTTTYFEIPILADITASEVYEIFFYKGAISIIDTTGKKQTVPLPLGIKYTGTIDVSSVTENIQAGDQYSDIKIVHNSYMF